MVARGGEALVLRRARGRRLRPLSVPKTCTVRVCGKPGTYTDDQCFLTRCAEHGPKSGDGVRWLVIDPDTERRFPRVARKPCRHALSYETSGGNGGRGEPNVVPVSPTVRPGTAREEPGGGGAGAGGPKSRTQADNGVGPFPFGSNRELLRSIRIEEPRVWRVGFMRQNGPRAPLPTDRDRTFLRRTIVVLCDATGAGRGATTHAARRFPTSRGGSATTLSREIGLSPRSARTGLGIPVPNAEKRSECRRSCRSMTLPTC